MRRPSAIISFRYQSTCATDSRSEAKRYWSTPLMDRHVEALILSPNVPSASTCFISNTPGQLARILQRTAAMSANTISWPSIHVPCCVLIFRLPEMDQAHISRLREAWGDLDEYEGNLVLCAHLYWPLAKLVRAQHTYLRGPYMSAPEMCLL